MRNSISLASLLEKSDLTHRILSWWKYKQISKTVLKGYTLKRPLLLRVIEREKRFRVVYIRIRGGKKLHWYYRKSMYTVGYLLVFWVVLFRWGLHEIKIMLQNSSASSYVRGRYVSSSNARYWSGKANLWRTDSISASQGGLLMENTLIL